MTDFTQTALEIASTLGDLTYMLGALIYALPVPFRGLKDWGPTLIKDGVYAVFLSAFYYGIISLASQYAPSWHSYLKWLHGNTNTMEIYATIFSLLTGIITRFVHHVSFLSSASYLLSNGGAVFVLLLAVSEFVHKNWGLLIAIGIMLFAVPFRMARSAGAYLIMFSVVLYIGLPFFQFILEPIPSPLTVLQQIFSCLYNQFTSNPLLFFEHLATGQIFEQIMQKVIDPLIEAMALDTIEIPIYLTVLIGLAVSLTRFIANYGSKIPIRIVL